MILVKFFLLKFLAINKKLSTAKIYIIIIAKFFCIEILCCKGQPTAKIFITAVKDFFIEILSCKQKLSTVKFTSRCL